MSAHPEFDVLCAAAERAFESAYAPYSGFRVGAAVLADDGRIFVGCNVENASFGATICAERSAVAAAVTAKARRLVACVVYTDHHRAVSPCGVCRQTLHEFGEDLEVTSLTRTGGRAHWQLHQLLPHAFGPGDLE